MTLIGDLHVLQRAAKLLRNLLVLSCFEQLQMIRDDLPGDAAAAVACFDLQQQALAHIARADAGRIERLHHLQGGFHIFRASALQIGRSLPRGIIR